ncbi:VOC family protein [Peribacillus faecalis]|uniref:VOC family protein n=1 Tax=Peribacillus faecalis TaxID=2772559 RepID=UPI0038B2939D
MSESFIEQVHYIRIPVKDLELSAQWYRDILGLQLLKQSNTAIPYLEMAVLLFHSLIGLSYNRIKHHQQHDDSAGCCNRKEHLLYI